LLDTGLGLEILTRYWFWSRFRRWRSWVHYWLL